MSAVLTEVVAGAANIFGGLVTLIPKGSIGGIQVQCTLEETATDSLVLTEHPVEAGAQITDHAYVRNPELVMRCGWSNSNGGLLGAVSTLVSGGSVTQALGIGSTSQAVAGNGMVVSDYVSGIYAQLLSLQQSLTPFVVATTIRQYTNMMLTSLAVTRDEKTSQALMVSAQMRQIIIVSTVSTTLAAQANQANPESTAETLNNGPQALQSDATPAPGGSLPYPSWIPTSATTAVSPAG